MSFEQVKEFFKETALWQKVAAGIIVLIIGAIIRFLWRILKRKRQDATSTVIGPVSTESHSPTQVGDGTTQNIVVDKSIDHGVHITVEPGAHAVINVIDYQDGIAQSTIPKVKTLFEAARADYIKRKFSYAIEKFKRCLDLETDAEKRGALNLQIGNCYYDLRRYLKAAVFYEEGSKEARKANDRQGQASNLVGIANTYMLRPASSSNVRAENVRKAVDYYSQSLQTFVKDEYPVDYAMTQNNLGTAYTDLPAATPEQRAQNVRNAIDCYKAALEIRKKDEYPVQYATTQNNLGTAYTDLPAATPEQRAQNVRNAIDCYKAALEIYKKDEYPVDYAMTQNNLGTAYTYLPAATPEQRAQNVRNAIDCYKAALEIYKKDEYPQSYCFTAANIGMILVGIDDTKACYWLKEAYALRQFLPDQGKRIEDVMNKVCD